MTQANAGLPRWSPRPASWLANGDTLLLGGGQQWRVGAIHGAPDGRLAIPLTALHNGQLTYRTAGLLAAPTQRLNTLNH
jgi:hypothetical protein